jgi:dCMP deaminase
MSLDIWDNRFLDVAANISSWSKDTSTKIGCVIVRDHRILSTGYNGFPRGCNDAILERYDRPLKYSWTEHSERNCVYNAAREGIPLMGATAYCVGLFPCTDCARALVQVGIVRLVGAQPARLELS